MPNSSNNFQMEHGKERVSTVCIHKLNTDALYRPSQHIQSCIPKPWHALLGRTFAAAIAATY